MIVLIISAGARVYKIQRNYTTEEFESIKYAVLKNLRFIKYDDEQEAFICENKLTAELAYYLFSQKIF